MTQTEKRNLEKDLINMINQSSPGMPEHDKAMQDLINLNKYWDESEKTQTESNLAQQRMDEDVRKNKEAERLKEKEIDKKEPQKSKLEKVLGVVAEVGKVVLPIVGSVLTTVVSYKCYDIQTTKALMFETTGSVTSATGKQIMSKGFNPKI